VLENFIVKYFVENLKISDQKSQKNASSSLDPREKKLLAQKPWM